MGTEIPGRLRFGVLGPLAAWRDGEPLALGGARQRALLALLLLHANELVTVEALVEALFGEERSDGTVNAVRVAVSRLRRLLEAGEENEVLQTRPRGYMLCAAPEQLDVAMFERRLARGGSGWRPGMQSALPNVCGRGLRCGAARRWRTW